MESQVILRIFDDALNHFLQALNGFVMMITITLLIYLPTVRQVVSLEALSSATLQIDSEEG